MVPLFCRYRISKPREKWSEAEHQRFVNAINQCVAPLGAASLPLVTRCALSVANITVARRHGRNWKRIVQEVGTRTVAQVRSFSNRTAVHVRYATLGSTNSQHRQS